MELRQGGTVAGAVSHCVDERWKMRFATLAAAPPTPRQNMRFDEPNSSACSSYTGATAGANTDDITLFAGQFEANVDSGEGVGQVHWSYKKHLVPLLVGPASLLVYTFAGTTQPSWFFTFKWAELSTSLAVQ